MNRTKQIYLFLLPIFTALYPILFLAGHNIAQIKIVDIERSLLFAFIFAVVISVVWILLIRSLTKGVIFSSLFLLIIESYGQIKRIMSGIYPLLGKNIIVIAVLALILLVVFIFVNRSKKSFVLICHGALFSIFCLSIVSAFPIIRNIFEQSRLNKAYNEKANPLDSYIGGNPDIYFIVLDSYARNDVLADEFSFDNSLFINNLEEMGFKLVRCSQSNYQVTMMSLVSTLNMEYVTAIPTSVGIKEVDKQYKLSRDQILGNKVWNFLKSHGYQSVAFDTGYPFSELTNATHYYPVVLKRDQLNNFEHLLLNTTIWSVIEPHLNQLAPIKEKNVPFSEYDESPEYFYQVAKNALNVMDDVTSLESPKFVYAHFSFPHDPYVFSENGENVIGKSIKGDPYIAQLKYANTRITKIIQNILANSPVPPIIILESDHGYDPQNPDTRLKNLMAFYAPSSVTDSLYDTMTPVNSFRLVLSKVFSENLPLLPDYSFFSNQLGKEDFRVMPINCPK